MHGPMNVKERHNYNYCVWHVLTFEASPLEKHVFWNPKKWFCSNYFDLKDKT
jgi:hypothetical protein